MPARRNTDLQAKVQMNSQVDLPKDHIGIIMNQSEHSPSVEFRAKEITQPAPALLRYYILCSLLAGPGFPGALIPLFCKYATLRYRFDESGIAMQ